MPKPKLACLYSVLVPYFHTELKKHVSFNQMRDVLKQDSHFIINDKPMKFY